MRYIFCFCVLVQYSNFVSATDVNFLKIYEEASANNSQIAVSRQEFMSAKEQLPQARAALLPSLSAESVYSQTDTSGVQKNIDTQRSSSMYKLYLTQPLFRADRWYSYVGAQKKVDQAHLKLAADEQDLILKAAEHYVAVLQAYDDLSSQNREASALERQLTQVSSRYKIGIATQAELYQTQAMVDSLQARQIVGGRKLRDALDNLESFTHQPHDSVNSLVSNFPIDYPQPLSAEAWVDGALKNNLRLQASIIDFGAASDAVKESRSAHLPSFDMVAQYTSGDNDALGYTNQFDQQNYGRSVTQRSVSLQVTMPIYTGGAINSRVRESVGRLGASEESLNALKWQLINDARNLYRAVVTGVSQLAALNKSIQSNQQAVNATQLGYDIGTGPLVDLLNAQRQLYESIRSRDSTRYDYLLDTLRLKQLVGTLSPDDLRALDNYTKSQAVK